MAESWTSRGSEVVLGRFILDILLSNRHTDIVQWTDPIRCEFKFFQPQEIARRWGEYRGKSDMNYDKFSRSIRYHYGRGILEKVEKEKFSYRFLNLDETTRQRIQTICRENQATGRTFPVPPRSYHRFLDMLGASAESQNLSIVDPRNQGLPVGVPQPQSNNGGAMIERKPSLDQNVASSPLVTPRKPSVIHHPPPTSPILRSNSLTLSPVRCPTTAHHSLEGLGLKRRRAPDSPIASTPKIQRLDEDSGLRNRFRLITETPNQASNRSALDGVPLLQSCLSLPDSGVRHASAPGASSETTESPISLSRNGSLSNASPQFSSPQNLPYPSPYSAAQPFNPYSAQAFLSACTAIGMEALFGRMTSMPQFPASPFPTLPSSASLLSTPGPMTNLIGSNFLPHAFASPAMSSTFSMSPAASLTPSSSSSSGSSAGSSGLASGFSPSPSSNSSGSMGPQQFFPSPLATFPSSGLNPMLWNRFQSPANGRS